MRILALETTERAASVAAAVDSNLLLELELGTQQRSAQSLAPGVQQLLRSVAWNPGEVELIALPVGPGSFTGLRLGVTMAKTFAYGVGAEVLGLDTLEVIASRAPAEVHTVSVAVDAQRGQVVSALFRRGEQGLFEPVEPHRLVDTAKWVAEVSHGALLSGPILAKLGDRLGQRSDVLPPECWRPTAAAVARLAFRHYQAGQRDDLWTLVPRYSRRSAAEEKWEARQKGR
jgi:tRNA threonylcarbamoyladenosine biosynthesis protein TsaB